MSKSLYSRQNDLFLDLLRRKREANRLRQADLASRLGVGQPTVSKVESGDRRLDVIRLHEWLDAMDVEFLEFMKELNELLAAHPRPDPRLRRRAARLASAGWWPASPAHRRKT